LVKPAAAFEWSVAVFFDILDQGIGQGELTAEFNSSLMIVK